MGIFRRWLCGGRKTTLKARGTLEDGPVSLDMDSPYSISKIIGEFYAVYYHKHHAVPTVRARFQNVYGPGEVLGAGKWRGTPATVWRNVIPTFIYRSLKGLPLLVEGDGAASRLYLCGGYRTRTAPLFIKWSPGRCL